jgi:serine/threonine protein kinase
MQGHFNEAESAYYIKQVIESLKYLHSEGIIHRDINILLCQGVLKLSDFGWSTYSPYAKRQTFCGTLDYVPPEIVEGDLYD